MPPSSRSVPGFCHIIPTQSQVFFLFYMPFSYTLMSKYTYLMKSPLFSGWHLLLTTWSCEEEEPGSGNKATRFSPTLILLRSVRAQPRSWQPGSPGDPAPPPPPPRAGSERSGRGTFTSGREAPQNAGAGNVPSGPAPRAPGPTPAGLLAAAPGRVGPGPLPPCGATTRCWACGATRPTRS